MPRRSGVVLVGVLLATVLSGCSPLPSDQVAIRMVDGEPEFVFAPCPGKDVHDVILSEENVAEFKLWHVSGGPEPEVTSIRLFHTPDGWIEGNSTLTELEPEMTYQATVYASDGRTSTLRFISLADIEALGEGQVLGPGETASRATPMSMADFEAKAAASCE
jgi:hypothetical protein